MIVRFVSVFLIFSAVFESSSGRDVSDCFSDDYNPYLKFATKTSYEFVYERPRLNYNEVPNCEPIQLWFLGRHGTRYPGTKSIRAMSKLNDLKMEIIRNHEELKNGRLCYPDINSLKSWSFNVTMADANMLANQGFAELHFLAKRLKTKFRSLFRYGYSPNLYKFRHTDSERTRRSAQAFGEGLFGEGEGVWIPPAIENDTLIKPYENCTYWIEHVKNNPDNQREAELFKLTVDMTALIHNVSLRLGFLYDLSFDTIDTIYDICRYDKAWAPNVKSPWCAAFSKDELRTLEYLEDIKAYYDSGYGDKLNLRLGCMPIKDMIESFKGLEDEITDPRQEPVGIFYFTHSAMLMMTLAKLEIANHGIPLRHDNYHEQRSRDWRTSNLSPFAGNLAAVFYKCTGGEFNRVMFFVNEKRVDYDGCDVGLCSWAYIREKFTNALDCNVEWCRNDGSISNLSSILLFSVLQYFLYKFSYF